MSTASTSLADQAFWEEEYLGDVPLPSRPDPGMEFERLLGAALTRHAPVQRGQHVLEFGCAPAKWLGFYAEHFGARVTGIEYTPHGADLSRRNLAALAVQGDVVEGDVFTVPVTPADLVLSLGFIEHFPDTAGVFARHVEFLAPGGTLVIGVPNYTGLMGGLQRLAGPEHLALHRRAAMPLVYGLATARRMAWTARINRPWLSTYLLTVLQRPDR